MFGFNKKKVKEDVAKADIKKGELDDMTTLSSCMTSLVKKGYRENFIVKHDRLFAPTTDKGYQAAETTIDDFYRFEGTSDPADNAVLYAIQTQDGVKGILLDAYGTYGDEELNKFIRDVEEIYKTKADNTSK